MAFGQPRFQISQSGISRCVPEVEPIGVDDDIDEVRIVERGRCPVKRRVVKRPGRRPLLPEDPAQIAAVESQALAAALVLKQMLVPDSLFEAGLVGVAEPVHIDNVVTRIGDQAGHSIGPQCRCNA